jgi:UDP-N-acetylmuramate dehydrogenase
MLTTEETLHSLYAVPDLQVQLHAPLSQHTRFALGGPADIFAETADPDAFLIALEIARQSGLPHTMIGGGTNLIVSDAGYRGIILKFHGDKITVDSPTVTVEAGAVLQTLVDTANAQGLKGLETMTGIPGFTGAAIYGNAGAYGHSISERVSKVHFHDGAAHRTFTDEQCEFHYRESIFKRHKEWIILSAELTLTPADRAELEKTSAGILAIRNEKYPPTMKCAGSIFKNFLLAELPRQVAAALPANVIREGKVPSAYFLEQAGAKGLSIGDIHVATYHANLIFNGGNGTAEDLLALILDLKTRVYERFGIKLEEEVQYVGFASDTRLLQPSAISGGLGTVRGHSLR